MTPDEKVEALILAQKERERQLERQAHQHFQREKEREEAEKQRAEKEKRDIIKYDAHKRFNNLSCGHPPRADGNKMKGFTVWCSAGYGNDN
jgi:hypothetical protein